MNKAIPFTFDFTWRWITKEQIITLIKENNKIKDKDIIWTIRWYYIDTKPNTNVPKDIYIWVSSNIKNNSHSVNIHNSDLVIDWKLDANHTNLWEIVITISFFPFWETPAVNDAWNSKWLAVVFYKWYSKTSIVALNHIYNVFREFISDFTAFQSNNRYLEEIVDMIEEVKLDYIWPYDWWQRLENVIYWTETIKPKYFNNDIEKVKEFIENSMDLFTDIPRIAKRKYIKVFWKKLPISEEDWRLIAQSFPQNINLKALNNWSQLKRLIKELSLYNEWVTEEAVQNQNIDIAELNMLKDYLWVLIYEYFQNLTNNWN